MCKILRFATPKRHQDIPQHPPNVFPHLRGRRTLVINQGAKLRPVMQRICVFQSSTIRHVTPEKTVPCPLSKSCSFFVRHACERRFRWAYRVPNGRFTHSDKHLVRASPKLYLKADVWERSCTERIVGQLLSEYVHGADERAEAMEILGVFFEVFTEDDLQ